MSRALQVSPYPEAVAALRMVSWGTVAYGPAMEAMHRAQRHCIEGVSEDTVFYLEHEPVVTYGRATPREHLSRTAHGLPMVEVSRGGLATYHGFGQLMGYLVIDLKKRRKPLQPDLHDYLRAVEAGVASYLEAAFALRTVEMPGLTGVWVECADGERRKVASIGVSVRRWVTAHGFALNLTPDLDRFRAIVPCGITDYEMTSVARELERSGSNAAPPTVRAAARDIHLHMAAAMNQFGWCLPPGASA